MTSVSANRIGRMGAIAGGGGTGAADVTGKTLSAIAGDVAATIAGELGLATDADGGRGKPDVSQDLYGIEQAAGELAQALNATPREAGEIARLLHLFAAEVAARIGAVPDARSLDGVVRLVSTTRGGVDNAAAAIRTIEGAVRALAA